MTSALTAAAPATTVAAGAIRFDSLAEPIDRFRTVDTYFEVPR